MNTIEQLVEALKTCTEDEYGQHLTEVEALRQVGSRLTAENDEYKISITCYQAQVDALTVERDSLQEELDGWHARCLDAEIEFARLVDVCHAAKLRLAAERDALRAEIVKNGEHLRYVEGQETLRCAEVRALEAERDAMKEPMTADRKQFLDMEVERDAHGDGVLLGHNAGDKPPQVGLD